VTFRQHEARSLASANAASQFRVSDQIIEFGDRLDPQATRRDRAIELFALARLDDFGDDVLWHDEVVFRKVTEKCQATGMDQIDQDVRVENDRATCGCVSHTWLLAGHEHFRGLIGIEQADVGEQIGYVVLLETNHARQFNKLGTADLAAAIGFKRKT